MEASKWLDIQVLLDPKEMEQLFQEIVAQVGPFQIFLTGRVVPEGQGEVHNFLSVYRTYTEALKQGQLPNEEEFRPLFSTVWTLTPDVLSVTKFEGKRELLRLKIPAVQLQPHFMAYSLEDGKFYSMVYGRDTLMWGIQFSYPQLYLEPERKR